METLVRVMVEVLEQMEEEAYEKSNVEERLLRLIDIITHDHVDCFRHFIWIVQTILLYLLYFNMKDYDIHQNKQYKRV